MLILYPRIGEPKPLTQDGLLQAAYFNHGIQALGIAKIRGGLGSIPLDPARLKNSWAAIFPLTDVLRWPLEGSTKILYALLTASRLSLRCVGAAQTDAFGTRTTL